MQRTFMRRATAVALALWATGWHTSACAYRPFNGTDAAVAGPGEMELEFGPVGYLREGSERTLIAPAWTLNYGFRPGWEVVIEGQGTHGLSAGNTGSSLVDMAVLLKGVLREGSLQDKAGPSVATEWGLLLPGLNAEPGTGLSVAAIMSQRWPWMTLHLNVKRTLTRQQHGALFVGAIVEGSSQASVRPVAEVFQEHEQQRPATFSGLIGVIWQVRDGLAVDVGLRRGWGAEPLLTEVRLGLTFGLSPR